jgi:hypothetical protein
LQQFTVRRFGDPRETHILGKNTQLPKPEPAQGRRLTLLRGKHLRLRHLRKHRPILLHKC